MEIFENFGSNSVQERFETLSQVAVQICVKKTFEVTLLFQSSKNIFSWHTRFT